MDIKHPLSMRFFALGKNRCGMARNTKMTRNGSNCATARTETAYAIKNAIRIHFIIDGDSKILIIVYIMITMHVKNTVSDNNEVPKDNDVGEMAFIDAAIIESVRFPVILWPILYI